MVIVPIYRSDEELELVTKKGDEIFNTLKAAGIRVKFDTRDTHKPGFKFAEYELKGVPLRITVGPRDLANNQIEIARRDNREKSLIDADINSDAINNTLDEIQKGLFDRAKDHQETHITSVDTWDDFKEALETKTGFISAHWDGSGETEQKIKEATKATIRCIPLDNKQEAGACVFSGNPSTQRVLFAKAY